MHQPDIGRKIRKDANVVASLICTLPKEIAPDDAAAVDAWASVTLAWLRKQCPGQLAYAVLHQDESRPHIHAAVIPAYDRGHLSYKKFFSGKDKLRALQRSYSAALAPLGVEPGSERVKAVRRTQYTPGINGWRVGSAIRSIAEQVQALEKEPLALPAPKRRESLRKFRERIIPAWQAQARLVCYRATQSEQDARRIRKEAESLSQKLRQANAAIKHLEYHLGALDRFLCRLPPAAQDYLLRLAKEQNLRFPSLERAARERDRDQGRGL